MRRIPLLIATAMALVVVACRDGIPPPNQARTAPRISNEEACTPLDLAGMLELAGRAFGEGSPNYNSVRGKIENMVHHDENQNPAGTVERAHDIVDFTLTKHNEEPLPGGDDAVIAMANAVYCYAGVPITLTDASNSRLIFPLDEPQVFYTQDSTKAISFPGDPVEEPSLVTITTMPTSQLGALTKLDRYPGFIEITQQNAGGSGLKYKVTISVCAQDVPEEVFADLRLGHGKGGTTFEITPQPTADDPSPAPLSCDQTLAPLAFGERVFRAAAGLFSPDPLHATAALAARGGGVSGTASEFSPFEPVDTKLRSGGGVSGTASEFIRMTPMASLMAEGGVESLVASSTCAAIPVGSTLPADCLPTVTIETRNGTKLVNVPVDWYIPAVSGGTIALADGTAEIYSCGTYARSVNDVTSTAGTSTVCWQVDTVGTYTAVARPRFGGDAPEGVTFFDDNGADTVLFTLDVQDVLIAIASPNPVSAAPGATLTPRVRVTLVDGTPAAGVTVHWTALANSDASVAPTSTLTDAEGYTGTEWTIGAGYNELRARVANAADSVAVTFSASGLSSSVVMNSCEIGGSRDPINETATPYGFWVPGPGNGNVMREVDLYFGASGKANRPSDYRIALVTRTGNGFLSQFADTTIATIELRGSASENKLATFRLNTPITGGTGNANTAANAVAMQLVVLTNPDGAKVNFNTGPCSLGNCKVPKGCAATEVELSSVTANRQLGTTYRKSVGITIRGDM